MLPSWANLFRACGACAEWTDVPTAGGLFDTAQWHLRMNRAAARITDSVQFDDEEFV